MSKKRRYLIAAALLLLTVAIVVKGQWFPAAREPGYRFVALWGETGGSPA